MSLIWYPMSPNVISVMSLSFDFRFPIWIWCFFWYIYLMFLVIWILMFLVIWVLVWCLWYEWCKGFSVVIQLSWFYSLKGLHLISSNGPMTATFPRLQVPSLDPSKGSLHSRKLTTDKESHPPEVSTLKPRTPNNSKPQATRSLLKWWNMTCVDGIPC